MKQSAAFNLAIIAAVFGLGSTAQASAGQSPAVVELFTSQGCSSCPPANANLVKLSNDPDVLALSFSVTYWDYLGWKDIFGKREFTDRQVTYEPALGQSGPFTPQMVINGHQSTVGYDLNEIRRVIASEPALSGPGIALVRDAAVIDAAKDRTDAVDVWLVRYAPGTVQVPVARGENAGETLPHAHVVHELKRLGTWDGKMLRLPIPAATGDLKSAIIVQEQKAAGFSLQRPTENRLAASFFPRSPAIRPASILVDAPQSIFNRSARDPAQSAASCRHISLRIG